MSAELGCSDSKGFKVLSKSFDSSLLLGCTPSFLQGLPGKPSTNLLRFRVLAGGMKAGYGMHAGASKRLASAAFSASCAEAAWHSSGPGALSSQLPTFWQIYPLKPCTDSECSEDKGQTFKLISDCLFPTNNVEWSGRGYVGLSDKTTAAAAATAHHHCQHQHGRNSCHDHISTAAATTALLPVQTCFKGNPLVPKAGYMVGWSHSRLSRLSYPRASGCCQSCKSD